MDFLYMDRKEILQCSYKISRERELPMSKVHYLLKEMQSLESYIQSAAEINAERGMSAACMGFNPYDIERVQSRREERRLREIGDLLFPRPAIEMPVYQYSEINDDELPF